MILIISNGDRCRQMNASARFVKDLFPLLDQRHVFELRPPLCINKTAALSARALFTSRPPPRTSELRAPPWNLPSVHEPHAVSVRRQMSISTLGCQCHPFPGRHPCRFWSFSIVPCRVTGGTQGGQLRRSILGEPKRVRGLWRIVGVSRRIRRSRFAEDFHFFAVGIGAEGAGPSAIKNPGYAVIEGSSP